MYKSLQAARAIAAIMVVLYHLGQTIAKEKYFGIDWFDIPFSFGSAGVEFFFVLSGFIILSAHRNDLFKPYKLRSYIRKRILRIYPTYLIVFLLVFFSAILMTATRNTVPHDALIIFKSLLLIPQDKDIVGGTGAPALNVAWTLRYEMLFYFLFAFMIWNRWLSILIIGAFILLSLSVKYIWGASAHFLFLFISQDYLLLFAMGMCVSVACASSKIVIAKPHIIAIIGSILFLVLALDTVLNIELFIGWKTILFGIASSLIVFGIVSAEDKGNIVGGQNWMQLLGDSSYALYLIHFPLIIVLCKLLISIQFNKLGLFGAIISYVVIFGSCLLTSVVFHLWVEKPIAAYFRKPQAN